MGQDEEEPSGDEASGSGAEPPEGERHEQEAREDEAFRAALKHYSRRARLFKR